jgi:Flp pilus assembly protein TadG
MLRNLRRLFHCTRATAAVEAAIFAPIFLTLTLGVTDLGSGMFVRMTVNAATQAGATYAVIHSCGETCRSNIEAVMNDAAGDPSFCSGLPTKATCTAAITQPCATSCTVTVSASYPCNTANKCLILPVTTGMFSRSWTEPQTISSTVTVRIL